jgi:hypothetical protein
MATLRERARDDHKRVTGGIPSLSPERRFYLTDQELHRLYQQSLLKEVVSNENYAADPQDGKRTMADWEAQVGIPLQGERLIGRLKKLNSQLYFERSKSDPSRYGCYLRNSERERGLEYIIGFEADLNPEFTVIVQDDHGKFKKFIPGWRRVLMRLIRAKLISEPQANKVFGPPNRDSERWALFTQ